MFRNISISQLTLLFVAVLLFATATLFKTPQLVKRSDYLTPPIVVKHMAIGLNVQMADSFWLRAVQDFDYCDQQANEKECKGKSWLFQVLDLITDLDKLFMHAYHWGGLALTIIISDFAGATIIFDKGLAEFPNDWLLNYSAAYHSMMEEKDYPKAARRYLAAANNGAPNWVRILAGTLAEKGGDSEFAEKVVEHMIEINDDPKYIERLKLKLIDIRNKKVLSK